MDENASNALVIAGGILLSIMIISVVVLSFRSAGNFAKDYENTTLETNLLTFNSKFEIYNRDNLTIQDIVTVANLAHNLNEQNNVATEKNSKYYIKVLFYGRPIEEYEYSKLVDLIQNNTFKNDGKNEELMQFTCTGIKYNEDTGKVCEIGFK